MACQGLVNETYKFSTHINTKKLSNQETVYSRYTIAFSLGDFGV